MAGEPAAEIDITPELVRGLLRAQHPDLADRPLQIAANGWDNVTLRLGDHLAVRIPRRAAGAELLRHEQDWLPVLAPSLGIDVPVPVRTGRPTSAFPWSWSVVPWFDGVPAATVPVPERTAFASRLAGVVARLHVPAPADAPVNAVRGGPLDDRDAPVRTRIGSGSVPDPQRVLDLWDDLRATPHWAGPPLWLHGDLHPINLVVDGGPDSGRVRSDGRRPDGMLPGRRLRAVLDFGDMTAGDPATDLATAWLTFDATGRRIFREHLTSEWYDDATWRRARAWALSFATVFLAHSDDNPVMAAIGAHTMHGVLASDE